VQQNNNIISCEKFTFMVEQNVQTCVLVHRSVPYNDECNNSSSSNFAAYVRLKC